MLEYFVYCYGKEIIGLILCAIFGMVGNAARKIYQKHVADETSRIELDIKVSIAKAAAAFVEQAWKHLHGEEKLQQALKTAETLLRKKGIPFDADEMMVLIEAAVAEFNEAFRKPIDGETADGCYRVPSELDSSQFDMLDARSAVE